MKYGEQEIPLYPNWYSESRLDLTEFNGHIYELDIDHGRTRLYEGPKGTEVLNTQFQMIYTSKNNEREFIISNLDIFLMENLL